MEVIKMTLEDVQKRIKDLKSIVSDIERFHSEEDRLYEDFIRAIADDKFKSKTLIKIIATELLKTQQIVGARWCS